MAVVTSPVINAFACTGSSYLFRVLDGGVSLDKIKRHNIAIEQLDQAKELFYENEIRKRDKIQELRQQLSDANADINDTNQAHDQLRQVLAIQYKGKTYFREPQLSDFYTPSDKMKDYQMVALQLMGVAGGWAGYKIYKNINYKLLYLFEYEYSIDEMCDILEGKRERKIKDPWVCECRGVIITDSGMRVCPFI